MKIYYWTPYMGNIGTIKATINSAIAMKRLGHEVKIYKTYEEWEGYEERLEENNIEIIDFNLKKTFPKLPVNGIKFRISMILISICSFQRLKRNFEEDKPDVVIASLLGYLPLLVRMFSKHKVKIISSIQGKPKYHFVRKILWKMLYSKSDQIIALTESTKNDMIKNLGLPENKITVLANPVIDESIDVLKDESIENSYTLKGKVILGVGRLTRQKNFETLIRAYYEVQKKEKSCLIIIGEGEDREKLERLCTDLGIQDNVYMPGFVKNPYKYMAKADVFVLSSLWEDPGHVLMEAAYLKTPIVSTRCPHGPEEFLESGQAGFLCDVGDYENMANEIIETLREKNEIKVERAYKNSLNYHILEHGKKLNKIIENI